MLGFGSSSLRVCVISGHGMEASVKDASWSMLFTDFPWCRYLEVQDDNLKCVSGDPMCFFVTLGSSLGMSGWLDKSLLQVPFCPK